jgi:copper(I)-binding protein
MFRSFAAAALALTLALPTAAEDVARAGSVVIADPWARASIVAGRPGAAYLTLRNEGAKPDALVEVTTPAAGHAMLHETTLSADGVARMSHVEALEIPPGGAAILAPGGHHLMLMDLSAPLREGETVALTLRFRSGAEATVTAPVLGPAAKGPAD